MTDPNAEARDVLTERFKFNLLVWSALAWVALSGVCTTWLLATAHRSLANPLGTMYVSYREILHVAALCLVPGFLLLWWGKRRAAYDPPRDLKHIAWRLPLVIGVGGAIAFWALGAVEGMSAVSTYLYCTPGQDICDRYIASERWKAGTDWIFGWTLFWAATMPASKPTSLAGWARVAIVLALGALGLCATGLIALVVLDGLFTAMFGAMPWWGPYVIMLFAIVLIVIVMRPFRSFGK